MFPNMLTPEAEAEIALLRSRAFGWKFTGAGGGGYLIAVSEKQPENAIKVRIRRK